VSGGKRGQIVNVRDRPNSAMRVFCRTCGRRIDKAHWFGFGTGRPRRSTTTGRRSPSVILVPCVAWKNEALCKFIFMNLRTTVTLQEETGYTMDYAVDRFFPEPIEPLIAA
jgi:hypothetical protein